MKKALTIFLCLLLLSGLTAAYAIDTGEARAVIGANLLEEEINTVYDTFGIERGSVTELRLTNAEERSVLSGLVDESVIGTSSISCVYLRKLGEGEGNRVSVSNVNWCTQEMYANALLTAGVTDVEAIITAPYAVSGTAALAGIYKAYEDMTGQALDDTAKSIGTQELVITGELAEEIGSLDAAGIVGELKLVLSEAEMMSDEELNTQIRSIASDYSVNLNDSQVNQLADLCRQMQGMSDSDLVSKVKELQETVNKLSELREKAEKAKEKLADLAEKADEAKEKLESFAEKAQQVFATIREQTQPVLDFIRGLFEKKDS